MQAQAAEPLQGMILLRRENPAVWSWRYGNLYTYTFGEAPIPITSLGNITAPTLAPDGKTIAFAAIAESVVSKAVQGEYTFDPDRDDPMDIWLMNRETYHSVLIAAQPQDKAVYRSSPVWSPDSQKLAWFTLDGTQEGGNVVIYDRKTSTSTMVVRGLMMNMGDARMFNLPNLVGWGSEISHTVFRVDSNDQNLWLESIDSNGKYNDKQLLIPIICPELCG